MSICLKVKEGYLNDIKIIEESCKENLNRLNLEDRDDEAILEKIKLNVIDIFLKMFNISFNKAYKNGQDEKIELENLKEEYFKFFEKIPAPWRIKLVKDKEHNMMEDYYKEKIKLEMVDEIKSLFMKHFEKNY